MLVNIVQCRGTPYNVGRQQAEIFGATRRGRLFQNRKLVKLPPWFDMRTEERVYAKYSPALWEEIAGIADGLGVPSELAYLHFGNGRIAPRIGGCSAVITPETFGRNYDFQPEHYGARLALVQPAGSYASIGFSELLTGRLDGMNEHGLTVALHLVSRSPIKRGMSCVLMIRMVLDQCADTDEATVLLKRLPHAMRYNYSLLDAKGKAAVIEAAPETVEIRIGRSMACTNHFQSAIMRPYNRAAHRTSWTRLPPLERWASKNLQIEEMFQTLNNSSSPAFFGDFGRGHSGTLHTIELLPVPWTPS